MRRASVVVLILLLYAASSYGSVEMLARGDTVFVAWCTDAEYACLAAYIDGSPVQNLVLGDCYHHASVCLAHPAYGDRLIVACSKPYFWENPVDTAWVLDPSDLSILNHRTFEETDYGFDEWVNAIGELHLPRYWDGSDSMPMVASIGDCTTDIGTIYLASARMTYPDEGDMVLDDTLSAMVQYGAWGPPDFVGPVVVPGTAPLSSSVYAGWTPNYFEGRISAHLSQEEPSRGDGVGEMYSETIYYEMGSEFDTDVLALGSCGEEGLALWYDSSGTVYTSVFDGSIEPSSTFEYGFPWPATSDPSALTQRPEETGMLLAWYHDGEIRVRHWLLEWNGYDCIVESGVPTVSTGNIATCSVITGYWVAWLADGATYPVLAWVDRATVTGIGSEAGEPGQSLTLLPSSNPFSGSLTIVVTGSTGPFEVQVYDLSGRLLATLPPGPEGSSPDVWDGTDCSGSPAPRGAYILRATSGDLTAVTRVVKL